MVQEGLDPTVLDMDPTCPSPALERSTQTAVAIKDDPRFARFFTMIRMHVPKEAVAAKMVQEGLDPTVLDMDTSKPHSLLTKTVAPSSLLKDKSRRKRLHWKGIDSSKLATSDCIWSNLNEGPKGLVIIDETEFENLFVEKDDEKKLAPEIEYKVKKQETSKVSVVDGKRAMNGAIALARVRISLDAIATCLNHLDVRILNHINEKIM
jgi:hypothetical protein